MNPTLKRWLPWAALTALALPALWPYTRGWPQSADGMLHVLRTVLLDAHMQRGMLYPRWVPELVLGYGYPVFSFYGPATFYLAEALHLLGLGFYQAVMGTLALLVVAGGFGMYVLARDVLGERNSGWGALVAAVAYVYLPYLLLNVYVRGAIGEVGAQALLPWIFWSFRRLLLHAEPARWVLPAALSLGALAATHNITLLFLPPVLLAYLGVVWWQTGQHRTRLGWVAAAGVAAMGVSAFFWLPLIGERQFLSDAAYKLSAQLFIPENIWTWRNFLDTGLRFTYTGDIPLQLGLMQAGLGLAGFAVARRRDAEWLFWLALVVAACLAMSELALGVWLSSDLLQVAQFPWRLLIFVGLALALLTGGLLRAVPGRRWPAVVALLIMGLIIFANQPRLPSSQFQPVEAVVDLASVAQFESETAGLGTSSAREFMPRWVEEVVLEEPYLDLPSDEALTLRVESASPYELNAVVTSARATQLRLADFYYPGWEVRLDERAATNVAPSTTLGLLTVDIPAGTHRLHIRWQGTTLQSSATLVSLLALAVLTLFAVSQRQQRWLGALPLALLVWGAVATFKPLPATTTVQPPAQPLSGFGLELLGLHTERASRTELYVHPYWHVRATPPRLQARWQVRDSQGQVVAEVVSEPHFSAYRTDNWPASTLVDDVYRLTLPPDLPAGGYELWLGLQLAEGADGPELAQVGALDLEAVPLLTQTTPALTAGATFDNVIRLAGYDLHVNNRTAAITGPPVVVKPGDRLAYTLYWQPLRPLATNYHGLLHLLDASQGSLAQRDQLAGSWSRPPRLWDAFRLNTDTYLVEIPAQAAGGVYWPHVGLYHFDSLQRLAVAGAGGEALGDTFGLAPVKVVAASPPPPQQRVAARFEDVATLLGYDLSLPPGGVHAGESVTLTVYYRSEQATTRDYTRFVHVFSPELGMAGQADSAPQQGLNPTWSWVPGEVIVDRITLALAPEALPGTYTIRLGLYDPAAEGARLAVFDHDDNPLPDGSLPLAELTIEP